LRNWTRWIAVGFNPMIASTILGKRYVIPRNYPAPKIWQNKKWAERVRHKRVIEAFFTRFTGKHG